MAEQCEIIEPSKPKPKPLNKGSAKSNSIDGSEVAVTVYRVEFNVFFDGTWNSKFNSNWYNNNIWYQNDTYDIKNLDHKDIETPEGADLLEKTQILFENQHNSIKSYNHHDESEMEQQMRERYKADQTSFARAPTGVDQMHRAAETSDPYIIPLYIDGSGTTTPSDDPYANDSNVNDYHGSAGTMQNDASVGASLGWLSTGVNAKLDHMCKQIQAKLDKLSDECTSAINIVTFNVYGFSRGSATARMFVNRVIKQQHNRHVKEKLLDLSKHAVMVKFVGLFDTVSSIGLDHTNDVKSNNQELDFAYRTNQHDQVDEEMLNSDTLDFSEGVITGKIVHLVAGHEFRQKYSVTNIKKAVESGYGFEVVLPGNHTDIGDGKSTEKEFNPETKRWIFSGNLDKKTILQHRQSPSVKHALAGLGVFFLSLFSQVARDQTATKNAIKSIPLESAMQILIDQGWFKNTNTIPQIWTDTKDGYERLNVDRTLELGYPKVPTWIMIALMKEMGEYRLNDSLIKKYQIGESLVLNHVYDDLLAQVMQKWNAKSKGYVSNRIINNEPNKPAYTTIKDMEVRKTLFNEYLQWSGEVKQSSLDGFITVNLPRIDETTYQFYRTVVDG